MKTPKTPKTPRDARNVIELIDYSANEECKFLFFWKNIVKGGMTVDKSCLSQWHYSPFSVEGVKYLTAEHYMMGKKALLFNDNEIYEKVMKTVQPSDVKSLGRKIKNFDEELWSSKCFDIVVNGNYHKFSQNHKLKEFLAKTGDKVLVEASPYDCIWGIGLEEEDSRCLDVKSWRGKNLLGFALMEVRDMIKSF